MTARDSPNPGTHSGLWSRVLPYFLIFLGFALRLYRIAYQSIWWDEAYSLHIARDGLAVMFGLPSSVTQVHLDHPPLYYGLLSMWTRLAGLSELSLRYLSLLFGVLLLPVVYRVAHRLFGRPTGLAAVALTALSPLYVVYSQEVRVYVLLPLLYLLLVYILHRLVEAGGQVPLRLWLGLAVVEALLLYSHYFAALGVLYANLFLLAFWLWRHGQRRISLRRWIGSQLLAAALYAPWAWEVILNWGYFRSRGRIREPWVVPPGPLVFARRIWRFTVSGNGAAAESLPLLSTGAALLALIGVLTILLAFRTDQPSKKHLCRTWMMLAHGLIPLALCFALWQAWPDAQPRYTLVFSIPLFLVLSRSLAVLLTGRSHTPAPPRYQAPTLSYLAGALLALALALVFGTGLYVQYFDERFHKDDVRSVAAYLQEMSTVEDAILIGPDDYSVPYYYDGPAFVAMAHDDPRADKVRHLGEVTTGKQRLFLVRWEPSKADLHGLRPFLLEQAGRLVAWRDFRGLDVCVYALDAPTGSLPELSEWGDLQARFGPLLMTGAWYEPATATDDAVAVALRWRLDEPADGPYKVVVMLTDAEGRRISSADILLLDEVMAELDSHRQRHLLQAVSSVQQSILTTTGWDVFGETFLQKAIRLQVREGRVQMV